MAESFVQLLIVIYLASHDETMSQLLAPAMKDIKQSFAEEFAEMPTEPATLEDLLKARETLITTLKPSLTQDERKFLLSIKEGRPDWTLLGIDGAEKLPAIQWKLANIKKMKAEHHRKSVERLKTILLKTRRHKRYSVTLPVNTANVPTFIGTTSPLSTTVLENHRACQASAISTPQTPAVQMNRYTFVVNYPELKRFGDVLVGCDCVTSRPFVTHQ